MNMLLPTQNITSPANIVVNVASCQICPENIAVHIVSHNVYQLAARGPNPAHKTVQSGHQIHLKKLNNIRKKLCVCPLR